MVQAAPGPSTGKQDGGDSPRGLARKREILRAAATLFRRQGMRATGMREIAAAAGMAVGNLYYYFADKQALLAFCQQDALDGLLALAAGARELPLPADQRLWLLIVGHMLRLHEATPGAIAHLDVGDLAPADRAAVLTRRDAYEATYREVVRQGIAEGVFHDVDAKLAAVTLLGALNWSAQWYRAGGAKTPRQLGEEMGDLLVRGLLREGRPLHRPAVPESILPTEGSTR
jgi:AcrR family transcriptional regulator